jgi:hypothetical protein
VFSSQPKWKRNVSFAKQQKARGYWDSMSNQQTFVENLAKSFQLTTDNISLKDLRRDEQTIAKLFQLTVKQIREQQGGSALLAK